MTALTFKHEPAEDDMVDPQYTCVEHPTWAIQDCRSYARAYSVNEYSHPASVEAPDDFWVRDHGMFTSLKAAKAEVARLIDAKGGAA